jgi:AraC-like DNA-binding protein
VWRAKRAARELIADPGLSAQRIARLQRVSLRTLQRAFEAEGASLMRWLRDERLERSAALLVDAGHRGHSIAEIAASLGFRDIPAFCRSFKRRFGASPSAWRATKAAAGGR